MTRRPNGEGSFYQQKDKSWVYQITYGRKADGSPYRKSFKGRTKTICKERRAQWEEEQARLKAEEEAQAAESARLEELRAKLGHPIESEILFSEAFPQWLDLYKRRLPESRLPTQAIWIPTASTSPKPLAICRSTRSRRTLCRTIISKSRKPALEQIRRKAAYPRKPSIISICC